MAIITYRKSLKPLSRTLRATMTVQELLLWSYLRKKQIRNIQFFRQRPIGNFIVDFYAPSVKLVIEVDGSQHSEPDNLEKDRVRDAHLRNMGLHVMRFENMHVERTLDLVLIEIENYVRDFQKIPPPASNH